MKIQFALVTLFLQLFCSFAIAGSLQLEDATITTEIVDQMPVDQVTSYPADYGKLFCFSRILGAEAETEVTHVWYYQDDELARVTLPVRSSNWRTYSSKRFLPQWAGQWQVKIFHGEDELGSLAFTLE